MIAQYRKHCILNEQQIVFQYFITLFNTAILFIFDIFSARLIEYRYSNFTFLLCLI